MKSYTHQLRVRYSEVDQLGVAYYANYFVWFEVGRVEYLRNLGMSYAELERQGVKLPAVSCAINYVAPARYDDLLDIKTTLSKWGRTSLTFHYEIMNHDTGVKLTDGQTVLVCVNNDFKPIRIPDNLKKLLG